MTPTQLAARCEAAESSEQREPANTRAELADERVGLVARAIEREAEECGFSIFSGDAESIARAVLSALRGQGEGWQAKVGDFVDYVIRPDWGPGEVQSVAGAEGPVTCLFHAPPRVIPVRVQSEEHKAGPRSTQQNRRR